MKNHSVAVSTILVEKSPQALPLGMACIASAIKTLKNKISDLEVKLFDYNLEEEITAEKIADQLVNSNCSVFCFSVFVWNRNLITEVKNILKQKTDGICIAGGPEVTANPESFSDFDYVISGEGEKPITDLIENLFTDNIPSQKIFYGKRCKLSELSSPYLDGTLDPSLYEGALWELARGCPFKCSYCYESKGEKTVDYFSMDRIKKELQLFVEKDIPQVFVLDPTYNANKNRAIEMLNYIAKNAPEIFFHFECRAEFLDRELVKAFSKIKCSLQIGVQSAHEDVLKLVNRGFNKKDFVKKIGILNDFGIVFGFDLIYGLPGDTYKGFKESIDFTISLYPNHLELFCLSVLPGTDLYDRAEELNLTFEPNPPYHVIKTDKFSVQDIASCEKLSQACNIFYSQGRAVTWFNSFIDFIKMRPSVFFEGFEKYLPKDLSCLKHKDIEKLQLKYIEEVLAQKNQSKYFTLISNIVMINGAFDRVVGEGDSSEIHLSYHPDDLLSVYSQDIKYFFQNANKYKCKIRVFDSKKGPTYKFIK